MNDRNAVASLDGNGRDRKAFAEDIRIRQAESGDIDGLLALEEICFTSDRLSRRSFKRWLKTKNCIFLVAEREGLLCGYGLVLLHQGTRLTRLYSLAVSPALRGMGCGELLMDSLENEAIAHARFYMRLEVSKTNTAAINLYRKRGFRTFGEYENYYQDHTDALRMQKRIHRRVSSQSQSGVLWYQQTTKFTCGPSALMMAMASLDDHTVMSRELELDLWREATTIFMTSGHGGCHPFGLALAASSRGFNARVYVNTDKPLFIEGVRSEEKKEVLRLVHQQFVEKSDLAGIPVIHEEISQENIGQAMAAGGAVIILISTYRLDGRKVPHWVMVTGIDESCLYVHDPDLDPECQDTIDCQHIPIARGDFARMSVFGAERLRTAVIIEGNKKA